MPREDTWPKIVAHFEQRDAATTEQLGCPLSLRVGDDVTCERAIRPRMELARLHAHLGGLMKAATSVAFQNGTVKQHQVNDLRGEVIAMREFLEQLRGDE